MKNSLSLAFASSLAFFAACGDNVTDNDPVATQAYEDTEAFPDCDESYEGMFAAVTSSKELYICTAEKWVNLSKAGSESKSTVKSDCSAKELADKSGVQVTCNGEAVGTLKYGKSGSAGSTGASGPKGSDGTAGSDGQSHTGTDATWDTDRCKLKNAGLDYMIYQCGDSTYVKALPKISGKPWKALDFDTTFNAQTINMVYNSATGATGTIEGPSIGALEKLALAKGDVAISGKAKLSNTEKQTVSAAKYRPFVGVRFVYSTTGTSIASRGGVCLTYSSEKDMNLLLEGETGFLKAKLPATKSGDLVKDTIVQLLWKDFEPVAAGASVERVVSNALYAYVEAAGSESVGEVENTFSVHQFGDYGTCDDFTFSKWAAAIKGTPEKEKVADAFEPSIEYGAVTIGTQTWLTESVRGAADTYSGCLDAADEYSEDCPNSGKVYTWLETLGADATKYGCTAKDVACTSTIPAQVQGICPDGYHIAGVDDWNTLFNTVAASLGKSDLLDAGNRFFLTMALFKEGGNISDAKANKEYGKNLTGLGLYLTSRDGYVGYYWYSAEYNASNGKGISFTSSASASTNSGYQYLPYLTSDNITSIYKPKSYRFPVRCLKDAEAPAP